MAEQEQGPPGGRRPVRRPRAGSFRADGLSHPPLEVLRAKACRERVEGWLRELESGREVVIHTRVRDSAAAGLLVWAVCALLVWLLLGGAMSPLRLWEAREGAAAASGAEAAAIVVIGLLTAVFVLVLAWGGVLLVVWVPWTRPELVVTQEALSSVGARGRPGEKVHVSALWADVIGIRAWRPGPGRTRRIPVPGGFSLLIWARGGACTVVGHARPADPEARVRGQVAAFPTVPKADVLTLLLEAHRRYGGGEHTETG